MLYSITSIFKYLSVVHKYEQLKIPDAYFVISRNIDLLMVVLISQMKDLFVSIQLFSNLVSILTSLQT